MARLVLTLAPGARPPEWTTSSAARGKALTVRFHSAGPVRLAAPVIEKQRRTWVVRLPGVGSLERKTGALENPARIFLDFTNAEIPAASGRNFAAGPIAQVRLGQQAAEGETPVARVAIELRTSQTFAEKVEGDDVVVSFTDPAPAKTPAAAPPPAPVPKPPHYSSTRPLAGRRIIVDPGHGGGDSGCQWSDGKDEVQECDVTLEIGLKVSRLLKQAGARVTLTHRANDPYVSPSQRREMTNRLKPDAFVSIHCNSAVVETDPTGTARGTEVWFTREDSQTLAMLIQEEMVGTLGTHNRGIKYTTELAVVNHSCCPAVLVEVGFLSDADDRALLTDPASQDRAAQAIVRGLARYFRGTAEEEDE